MPNALMAEYYAQRASAGLIISEATVFRNKDRMAEHPGIYSDEQAEAWKLVVDAVHARGTFDLSPALALRTGFSQRFHEKEGLPVAPSAIKINGDDIHTPIGKQPYETPRALETEEMPGIVQDYRRARSGQKQRDLMAWKSMRPTDTS